MSKSINYTLTCLIKYVIILERQLNVFHSIIFLRLRLEKEKTVLIKMFFSLFKLRAMLDQKEGIEEKERNVQSILITFTVILIVRE